MQTFIKCLLYYYFLALPAQVFGQFSIEIIDSSQAACSFRGLSVVTDRVVWVSGSKGTVGRSTNGGVSWEWTHVPGFEKSDFRDIEAFDAKRAVIMASGTPAVILKTVDGGKTWKLVFRDDRPEMFLDAMDFWDDKRGMMVGDPANGHFVLLQTRDGGDRWKLLDTSECPVALDSEAVFAASGTSLRCWGKKDFGFVTGGSVSRLLFTYYDTTSRLLSVPLEIAMGKPSKGAFSFSNSELYGRGFLHVAGGDYLCDTCSAGTGCFTFKSHDINEFGIVGVKSADMKGYCSCIELIRGIRAGVNELNYVATGSSHTEFNFYPGACTKGFFNTTTSNIGFNVVRQAKHPKSKAVFLTGGKGRIGRLVYSK